MKKSIFIAMFILSISSTNFAMQKLPSTLNKVLSHQAKISLVLNCIACRTDNLKIINHRFEAIDDYYIKLNGYSSMLVRNAKTAGVDYNLRKLTDLNYKAKKLEYKYNGPKKRN